MAGTHRRKHRFVREHSLSLVSAGILTLWTWLYGVSSPGTHESRRLPKSLLSPVWETLRDHSLGIFLVITGIAWIALYAWMDSETTRGQVVGIVSEWTQIFGLVLLTKRLIERHSKESAGSWGR
jgi:hypothetical protein